jgi:uridine kinase
MVVKHRTPENAVVIGVTGGIAAGKSTLTELIAKLVTKRKVAVLNGDHFGHLAYAPGTSCLKR